MEDNNKLTWQEQIGFILGVMSIGYWLRMGQHWADHDVRNWKSLIHSVKRWIHRNDPYWEDPESEEEEA